MIWKKLQSKPLNIAILAFFAIVMIVISQLSQAQLKDNNYASYDGQHYIQMVRNFSNDSKNTLVKAPFAFRIGFPYIVATCISNIDQKTDYEISIYFKNINYLAIVILIILQFYLLLYFLQNHALSLLASMIGIIHWSSYIRNVNYDPISVDIIALLFIYLSFLVIFNTKSSKLKYALVAVLCSIGVFFREIAIIPAIYLLINNLWNIIIKKDTVAIKEIYFSIIPVTISLLFIYLISKNIEAVGAKSAIQVIGFWLLNTNPIRFINSYFIAFGVIALFPIIYIKQVYLWLKVRNNIALALILFIAISYVGGTDTERFLHWGLPFFMTAIIMSIKLAYRDNASKLLWSIIFILQLYTSRVFFTLPDSFHFLEEATIFLTPINMPFAMAEMYGQHSSFTTMITYITQYSLLGALLYFAFKKKVTSTKKS